METRKLSIFALDDNPDDLVILSHKLAKLSDWEIEFHAFQSWKTAEKKLKSLTLDVIFIDYFLGLESGIDVIKEIRLRGDERPVIMLTGKGTEKVAAEVTRAGADDYLIKGEVTSDLLRVTISKVIEVYKSRCDNSLLKQQLKQSQKMETLGTLAGGIAHDFNNMLTAVMGYIELGVINIHEEEAKQDLEIAIQVCQQMADIVQNLLNFSRKEMSDRKSIGFNKIITLTENILRHILPKSINLAVSLPDPSYVIFGSETELQQVVLNLITNASEAMNGSGIIEIDCNEISIDTKQLNNHPMLLPGDYVCLEIRDQGSGMEESTIERIFEPFFTTKTMCEKRGTGLGLTIVWQIVKDHNGTVTVSSTRGNGTTFKVYLPMICKEEKQDTLDSKKSEVEIFKGTESILVVDDEKFIRQFVYQMLTKLGYKVYLASNGETAIDIFKSVHGELGCVILDVSMPKMDGKTCITKLQSINPTVPVIFASGHNVKTVKDELFNLGAICVLQKPYRITAMSRCVREAISGSGCIIESNQ